MNVIIVVLVEKLEWIGWHDYLLRIRSHDDYEELSEWSSSLGKIKY